MKPLRWFTVLFLVGCASATPAPQAPAAQPAPPTAETTSTAPACDPRQAAILQEADQRAAPWSTAQHLAKNFPDGQVSWLMTDTAYQSYIVKPAAKKWGRCNDTGCYVFVAPSATIHGAVESSMVNGKHDPAAIGKALGLPAKNFEGTLRMMTLDLNKASACARLPVETDPGVWPCKTPEDTDCFKFGGYTSGGAPELIVIDAPVEQTTIDEVQ